MNVTGWPMAGTGQAVGLLGGSFDPAHQGHVAISRAALRRFGLNHVWWLVSPGNPLKPDAPATLASRLDAARALVDHPHISVTDLETRLGTQLTVDTVAALRRVYPRTRFVWLMGADNLAQFHHWDSWDRIAETLPIGVLARPGERMRALRAPATRALWRHRVTSRQLGGAQAPAWSFTNIPMRFESSTALRRSGRWKQ